MLTLSATRGRLRYYRCHGVKILHDLHIYRGGGGKTLFIVRQISGPGSSLPCQDVKALSLRRFMGLHDCPELVSELGALQSSFPPRWKNIGNNTLRFSLAFPEHLLPKEHGKEITDKFLKVTVQWCKALLCKGGRSEFGAVMAFLGEMHVWSQKTWSS